MKIIIHQLKNSFLTRFARCFHFRFTLSVKTHDNCSFLGRTRVAQNTKQSREDKMRTTTGLLLVGVLALLLGEYGKSLWRRIS